MTEKTLSAETVAMLLASIMKKDGKNTIVVDYKFMSSLSGLSASALEHQYRGIRARARQLLDEANAVIAAGGELTPVPSPAKSKKRAGTSTFNPVETLHCCIIIFQFRS